MARYDLALRLRPSPAATPAAGRRRVAAAAARVGIAGPVVFAVVAFTHGALRADHDLVGLPISALSAGPSGWIQNLNFAVLGACMIALAVGLHRGVNQADSGVLAPAFLAISGIGLAAAALFPATDATGAFDDARVLHGVAAVLSFAGAGFGLTLMARRMVGDARWQGLAAYARAAGVAIVVLMVAGGGLARPPGAPLHAWLGLYQWVILAVWLPCTIALALRLLRVARSPQDPA